MTTRSVNLVENWLNGKGHPPSAFHLANYIVWRSTQDYPGDPDRGITPGELPGQDWLRRVSKQLALDALAMTTPEGFGE